MIAAHESSIKPIEVTTKGYFKMTGKVLISPETGWSDYVMRQFEVEKDGFSGDHAHDYPHIVYVIEGSGILTMEGKEYPITKGSFAYIPNNVQHQLKNLASSGEILKFTCIVPKEGHAGFGS